MAGESFVTYSRSARSLWFCIRFSFTLIVLGFVASCGKEPPTYTIGGTVSGLSGTGLVLQYNAGNSLPVSTNGNFTFSTAITSGASYSVTVLTQPASPAQVCSVINGSGIPSADVTTIQVACITIYTIGGTVSGLSGAGLVLQYNGGNNLSVSTNGSFTFSQAIANGGSYNVTVLTQPSNPTQICTVTNGSGTPAANVTSVQVACITYYTIGGTVSGLSGTGLVLQNNGGNNLSVSTNGSFTFIAAIPNGSSYNVTVLTQPTSSPAQNCTVTNGSGTPSADVTSVQVTCTNITYTIGGTVIDLAGTGGGLQLQDNGGDTLLVNANGAFTFATALLPRSAYSVTVFVQPASPPQTCKVTNGTGTATGNITSVTVDCGQNEWIWEGGSNVNNQPGAYGTKGTAAPANIPGARNAPVGWPDAAGNLWMFGGAGYDSTPSGFGALNDLWKYSAGEWTWEGGPNVVKQKGINGTEGTPAPGNIPGARDGSVSWTDTAENFWLFGGAGLDSAGTNGLLNDVWKYSAGEWTWEGGSSVVNQKGTYGTEGTPAPGNIPGARDGSVSWTDAAGNFWLFGGAGLDPAGTNGLLNDLWKYEPNPGGYVACAGVTVISISPTDVVTVGSPVALDGEEFALAGTTFQASSTPTTDTIDWMILVGYNFSFEDVTSGSGVSGFGIYYPMIDYATGTCMISAVPTPPTALGLWTWEGGSSVVNQKGIYGTEGTPAPGNIPGARSGSVSWTDAAGNFWLFGGSGYDSTPSGFGALNDLWKYSAGEWTWESGSNVVNQNGTYGTQGVAAPGNIPGARSGSVSWTDAAGNLWLFGGSGYGSAGSTGYLNDLWKYSSGEWTWEGGSSVVNQTGTYGTEGTSAPGNSPPSRWQAAVWTDESGNFWLFGGSAGNTGPYLNDLWRYEP